MNIHVVSSNGNSSNSFSSGRVESVIMIMNEVVVLWNIRKRIGLEQANCTACFLENFIEGLSGLDDG